MGGKFYIAYLPEWDRFGYDKGDDLKLYNRGVVLRIFKEFEIPVIDFLESLVSHPDPLSIFPFRKDAHYTAGGYSLLAKLIAERLKNDTR